MKRLALAVLLATALPAQAQLYKCVDSKGRTHYTDKPIADCKVATSRTLAAPPAPPALPGKSAAKKGAPAKATQVAKRAPTAEERARFESDCKVGREQLEWLQSPRGAGVPNHAARVGQVQQSLRGCP